MADKKVTISGTLSIDASKAEKALSEVAKKFKSFEKSSFGKQMDDMRKMVPLVKDIDKSLGKMMQSMVKSDAKVRMKELTSVLEDQAKELKDILKLQKDVNAEMSRTPKNSARYQQLSEKRDDASYRARATMQSMEGHGNEREELKKMFTNDFVKKLAVGAQAVMGAAAGASSYFGGQELRRLNYEAQAQSTGNRIGSMAFGKNIDLGSLSALGDLGSIHKGAREQFAGTGANKLLSAGGNILGAGVGGSLGGPAGIGVSVAGAAAGELAKNADLVPGMKTSAAALEAIRSNAQNGGMDASLAKTAFARELMNMKIDQAPMQVSAMQGMAGAGNMGKNYWSNYRRGVKYGVEMPESSAMMQMMGQSGAIGSDRSNITDMLRARNAGVAQPGEYASMVSGMAGVSSDGTKTASMVRKAMEEGVRIGVDRSLVKNLVRATTDIASTFNTEVSSTEGIVSIMNGLREALGPKADLSAIGQRQLQDAQRGSAIITEDADTALGIGTGSMVFQEEATALGGKQMSPAQMIALSKMKMDQKLDEKGPLYQSLLNDTFGGNKDMLDGFLAESNNMLLARKARMDVGFNSGYEGLTTTEQIRQHKIDLQSSDPAVRARAERIQRDNAVFETAFSGEQSAVAMQNRFGGQMAAAKGGNTTDESGQTGAGGMARYRAAIESLQQAAASSKEISAAMKIAMSDQLAIAKGIAGNPILQTMADGSTKLTISMDSLKASVDANTKALGGKAPDRVEIEAKEAKNKYQREQDAIKAQYQGSDKKWSEGNYIGSVADDVSALFKRAVSTNPDTIDSAVDTANSIIPQVSPSGK